MPHPNRRLSSPYTAWVVTFSYVSSTGHNLYLISDLGTILSQTQDRAFLSRNRSARSHGRYVHGLSLPQIQDNTRHLWVASDPRQPAKSFASALPTARRFRGLLHWGAQNPHHIGEGTAREAQNSLSGYILGGHPLQLLLLLMKTCSTHFLRMFLIC